VTAVVERAPWGLVVVGGPEATSFLQGLLSQDLEPVTDGQTVASLLLTPQGKLDVVLRATRAGDEWWLDTEADFGPRLAASLTRFRIRVKAEIEDRTADTGMLSFIGTRDVAGDGLRIPTTWGDLVGVDLISSRQGVDDVLARTDSERWDEARFEAFRIEQGVPRQGVDIDEKTIPQEAFLDREAVSFTKGCFLGQELVARIDSRGHVNRYLRQLRSDGSNLPPTGAAVVADNRDIGAVTSAATSADGGHVSALAMVRREVEPPATVLIRWDGREIPATVVA
jgi:tRNA-modifying protein YgfZ